MALSDVLQSLRGIWPPAPTYTEEQYPDLTGKTVIVTGANSGVGFESFRILASKNAKAYALVRNVAQMEEGFAKIREQFPNADLHMIVCDLSDLSTIKPAIEEFVAKEPRLDIIIHNAGVGFPNFGSVSAQGLELQLAVNVVAPYLIQKLLDPLMEKTANTLTGEQNTSRIVWISSSGQALSPPTGIRIDNLSDPSIAVAENYFQSKAGDVILCNQWPAHHPNSKIISITTDPGNLKTNISRDASRILTFLFSFITFPPYKGAHSELFPALHPSITTADNGRFTIPWGRFGLLRADVKETATGELGKRFWDWCDEQSKAFQ